jgi:hypothetical protein
MMPSAVPTCHTEVTNCVTLSRQRKMDVNENEKVTLRHLTACIPAHTFFKNIYIVKIANIAIV